MINGESDLTLVSLEELNRTGVAVRKGSAPADRNEDLFSRYNSVPNRCMLLYSSEDELLNEYVKKHWSALDGLSGDYCDIYVSLWQLQDEEDFYTFRNEIANIPGTDEVNPAILPVALIWSDNFHITISLSKTIKSNEDIKRFFREFFSVLEKLNRPIEAKDKLALLETARPNHIRQVKLKQTLLPQIGIKWRELGAWVIDLVQILRGGKGKFYLVTFAGGLALIGGGAPWWVSVLISYANGSEKTPKIVDPTQPSFSVVLVGFVICTLSMFLFWKRNDSDTLEKEKIKVSFPVGCKIQDCINVLSAISSKPIEYGLLSNEFLENEIYSGEYEWDNIETAWKGIETLQITPSKFTHDLVQTVAGYKII